MRCLFPESFFDPHIKLPSGKWYEQERYDQIIDEQVNISKYSGSITISDTDELSPHDRKLILGSLMKIHQQEIDAQEKAQGNMVSNRTSTSRYK